MVNSYYLLSGNLLLVVSIRWTGIDFVADTFMSWLPAFFINGLQKVFEITEFSSHLPPFIMFWIDREIFIAILFAPLYASEWRGNGGMEEIA